MSVRKFCEARGVSAGALYQWRSLLGGNEYIAEVSASEVFGKIEAENTAFIPIKIDAR